MKLQDLKAKTWDIWLLLHECSEAVPQPENFQPEVRAFGDLRYRETWKRALGNFFALSIARSVLEPVSLVTFYLNPSPDDWSWEVRRETFEAYIRIPGALELVREGLNEIFRSPSSYHWTLDKMAIARALDGLTTDLMTQMYLRSRITSDDV